MANRFGLTRYLRGAALTLVLGGASAAVAQSTADPIGSLIPPSTPRPAPEAPPPPTVPAVVRAAPPQDAADVTPVVSAAPPVKPAPAKPVEPMKRPRFGVAVIQALDKVTAETVRFEAPVNHPVRYKTLIFTVSACETTAPDEEISDAAVYVEIDSQPKTVGPTPAPARQVFRGWMFANSPGLHLFQHPIYDAWLIACKTASPPA